MFTTPVFQSWYSVDFLFKCSASAASSGVVAKWSSENVFECREQLWRRCWWWWRPLGGCSGGALGGGDPLEVAHSLPLSSQFSPPPPPARRYSSTAHCTQPCTPLHCTASHILTQYWSTSCHSIQHIKTVRNTERYIAAQSHITMILNRAGRRRSMEEKSLLECNIPPSRLYIKLYIKIIYPTPRIRLSVRPFVRNEKAPHHGYMHQGQGSSIYASFIPASYTHASGSRFIGICNASYIHASGSRIEDHRYMQHTYVHHAHMHQDQES